MTTDYASIKTTKRGIVLAAVGGQFALIFLAYCATPGYLSPLLNNSFPRMVLFFILLWQMLGVAMYALFSNSPERHILFAFQNTIFIVIFILPMLAFIFLGPAVVTSVQLNAGPTLN